MNLSLHKKLVLALLVSISLVILIMLLTIIWSFDRSFKSHVLSEIDRRDDYLIEQLIELYKVNGNNWSFIEDDPSIWFDLNAKIHLRRPPPHHRPPPPHHERPPRPFPPPRHDIERVLLDIEKQPISNYVKDIEIYEFKKITLNNELIGYLARRPLSDMFNPAQRRFIKHLRGVILMVAISSILVSLIIAWVLSRHFLKPIGRLKQGTTALTAGKYATRIGIDTKDELGELSQDFNLLAKTLEENEQSRKQWIADISHELRTPLSILRGEIEAVLDGVREMNEERMQALHNQVMHLNNLVNDLYELSMTDMGAMNYQMYKHDIVELLRESIEDISLLADEKSIELDMSGITTESIYVLSDYQRMHQLFSNLMMNSIQYTESPGQLKIVTDVDAQKFMIHFMDSSPSVSATELPKLFERLYRGESSRNRKTGGSGLGLSICSIITEAHNGSISAQQSPLGGLWITVSLPIYIS